MIRDLVPTQEKKYTYDTFFQKNRGSLVGTVKQMGFQSNDAQDIVHDAISEFLGNGELPPEKKLTREIIEGVVKPLLLRYIISAVNRYDGKLQLSQLNGHEALSKEEALLNSNVTFYLLLEYMELIPVQRTAKRIPNYLLANPLEDTFKRENIEGLYNRLQIITAQKEPVIVVEEIPYDPHSLSRDRIRDSRFKAEIIRSKKQGSNGNNHTNLKEYARYWGIGTRMASRLVNYARLNELPYEQAETLIERVATRPEARREFLTSYRQLSKER